MTPPASLVADTPVRSRRPRTAGATADLSCWPAKWLRNRCSHGPRRGLALMIRSRFYFTLGSPRDAARPSSRGYRLAALFESDSVSALLDGDGAVVIEWGDVVTAALPVDYVEVLMSFALSDDERSLVLRPVGHGWSTRFRAVEDALAAWRC